LLGKLERSAGKLESTDAATSKKHTQHVIINITLQVEFTP